MGSAKVAFPVVGAIVGNMSFGYIVQHIIQLTIENNL